MRTLDMLVAGDSAAVIEIKGDVALKERLCDLGIMAGSEIKCVMTAPAGDPSAYLICGAVMAIRKRDAENIIIADSSEGDPQKRHTRIIALAGNPNVGKSTLFNSLTGMRQHTGNWAGKTVGCAVGNCRVGDETVKIVDLPGTYSLKASSEEEKAARDFICSDSPDLVAVVCDATCLERNLILVLQILSITGRVIICVNLLDEAKKKGIEIDICRLSELLGIPAIGLSARSGDGIEAVKDAFLKDMSQNAPSACEWEEIPAKASEIAASVIKRGEPKGGISTRKLDRIFTGKYTGFPIMLMLFAIIFFITSVGANIPSEWLSRGLFALGDVLRDWLVALEAPWWLVGALIDGMYKTLAWVVSVMLPPMAIFFPLFTLLEDFGYLPRIAFNLDKCFCRCNACGKQALTM